MKTLARSVRSISVAVIGPLVWLGGCSASSKEGVTIAVEIESPRTPAVTAGSRTFDTDRGVHVMLTHGFLSFGSVEVFGCDTPSASRWWLGPLRLREAHAHVVGSPTLLGTPAVESLLADDGARTKMGELRPPPGSYCKVKPLHERTP